MSVPIISPLDVGRAKALVDDHAARTFVPDTGLETPGGPLGPLYGSAPGLNSDPARSLAVWLDGKEHVQINPGYLEGTPIEGTGDLGELPPGTAIYLRADFSLEYGALEPLASGGSPLLYLTGGYVINSARILAANSFPADVTESATGAGYFRQVRHVLLSTVLPNGQPSGNARRWFFLATDLNSIIP